MNKNFESPDILQLMDPNNHKGPQELIKVVRSLLRFIILESKEHIELSKREEYVKNYLFTLSKATNGLNNYVDMDKVKKQILIDISKHYN